MSEKLTVRDDFVMEVNTDNVKDIQHNLSKSTGVLKNGVILNCV